MFRIPRKTILGFASAALVVVAIGCNETELGGPGVSSNPGDTDRSSTFTLVMPTGASNVAQGASETFTITVNRGNTFDQSVAVRFEAPAGISIEPSTANVASADSTLEISVTAAATASPGKKTIKVVGTPETGAAVYGSFDIEVVEP